MSQPYVQVVKSVTLDPPEEKYKLAFEFGIWHYADDTWEEGYRFIYYRDGAKMAHRGQTRIPDYKTMLLLQAKALEEGWLFLDPNQAYVFALEHVDGKK